MTLLSPQVSVSTTMHKVLKLYLLCEKVVSAHLYFLGYKSTLVHFFHD